MGCPGGGAIFRDKSGTVLRCFEHYYGICDAFHAELVAAMAIVDIAHKKR